MRSTRPSARTSSRNGGAGTAHSCWPPRCSRLWASRGTAGGAPGRPFRLSVRGLQALVAARKGNLKLARELWTEISKDAQVPQGTQQRVTAMLSLYGAAEAK